MIAAYIKLLTRSMNSWIYGVAFLFAGCMKGMVKFFLQFTLGSFLSFLGYEGKSLSMTNYIESVSEMTIAGIIVQLVIFGFIFWYFINSSIDPIVRIKDYSNDQCKLENLEIQLSELKEKSLKESDKAQDVKKIYNDELKKNKIVSDENKNLKDKVKDNEADKKKIEKLQQTVKEREDQIEIKSCEIDKLQIALQSLKDEVENCKSEYKKLETKFFDAIKELDVKDCAISDLEDGEKEYKNQLSEKDKEIFGKEELVKQLYEQIKTLEQQIEDLELSIEDEKKLSNSVKLEKDILEETSLHINKISDAELTVKVEGQGEDAVKAAEQLKAERLAMLTDASKIKNELSATKSELVSCKEQLTEYKKRNVDLEEKYQELNKKFDLLNEKTNELKNIVQRKDIEIATISKFFSDRENELQALTTTQNEDIQKLIKDLRSIGEDRRQIAELNKQIDDLKEEIISNEKQFKTQVASIEEESHANYLKMRTATRECEEHKREKEIYRKKLLDNDMQPLNKASSNTNTSLSANASLDISDRSESPGSNKSMEEPHDPRQPLPGQMRPPVPFPPGMMYRGMSPFPQRPPMGPFRMPPRLPFVGPPRPFMPVMRQPPPNMPSNIQPNPGYQPNPHNNLNTTAPPTFDGQEYVNTLIDNLANKDVRTEKFDKQNKTVS